MSRSLLNWLLLLTAIGLGSYTVWQWQRSQVPPPEPVQRSDYVLRDFELTALDDEGAEAFTVVSPSHTPPRSTAGSQPAGRSTWSAERR